MRCLGRPTCRTAASQRSPRAAFPPGVRLHRRAEPRGCGAGAQSALHGSEGGSRAPTWPPPSAPRGGEWPPFRVAVAGRAGGLNGACEPSLGGRPALISPALLRRAPQRRGSWRLPSRSLGLPARSRGGAPGVPGPRAVPSMARLSHGARGMWLELKRCSPGATRCWVHPAESVDGCGDGVETLRGYIGRIAAMQWWGLWRGYRACSGGAERFQLWGLLWAVFPLAPNPSLFRNQPPGR